MLIRTIIEGERNNKNRKKRTTRTLTLSHYTLLQLLFLHTGLALFLLYIYKQSYLVLQKSRWWYVMECLISCHQYGDQCLL